MDKQKTKEKIKEYFDIPESRKIIYDYIRTISCIGIICLHVTGDRSDLVGVIFETLSRVSLPMFVLLSGLLILGSKKVESYPSFYYKRFLKVVVPYLIYGAIYIGWVYEGHGIPEMITIQELKTLIRLIPYSIQLNLLETPYFHLWFMFMIFGFYVVAPFLKKGLSAFDFNDLKWLFLVMLIVYGTIDYLPTIGINIGFNVFFPNWIIYFLAGYIMSRIEDKKMHICLSIIGILSLLLMFYWKMFHPGIPCGNFYDLAPHMMLAVCGCYSLFILLQPYITKIKIINWIIMKISNYTFSIYMLHGVVLTGYVNTHPGYNLTVLGTIRETLTVFLICLMFVIIFDNLITKNIQRLIDLPIQLIKKKKAQSS